MMTLDDFKKEEEDFEKNHRVKYFLRELWYDCTYRLWQRIIDTKNEIKWAWQRAYRGFDDTAYWGLDSYVTEIVLPVLKWYRKDGHGLPHNHDTNTSHTEEEWNARLDKMIVAFELIKADDMDIKTYDDHQRKIQEGLKEFAVYFQALWD